MLENMECEKNSYKKDENVKKITMKRIAEEASVSVSCVARCVNNSGYVAEEKRRRISEVMDRLHYIPNQQAKCLRDGCSKLIGHIHVTSEERKRPMRLAAERRARQMARQRSDVSAHDVFVGASGLLKQMSFESTLLSKLFLTFYKGLWYK